MTFGFAGGFIGLKKPKKLGVEAQVILAQHAVSRDLPLVSIIVISTSNELLASHDGRVTGITSFEYRAL
jgi:hypothetical protein